MREYIEAVKTLTAVTERGVHLDEAVGENAFASQIAYGVTRYYYSLNAALQRLLKKPLPKKHQDVKMLLLAGLYSVDHLNRPAHASVNAAVEATRALKKQWASGLVNGILRSYLRSRPDTDELSEARLNHPGWLIAEIEKAWPRREDVFAANNQQAPLTLRVNLAKTSRDDYLECLSDAGIEATPGLIAPSAVYLDHAMPVEEIPGFTDGMVSVQDEAPQLAPLLMNLSDDQSVLDACAAPGGKTCHILETVPGIKLTAIDIDAKRMQRVEENLIRIGVSAVMKAVSLTDLDAGDPGFDRILLDGPCSATGIIRRHPDIKLLRSKSDVDKLCQTQRVLINKAFDLLTPGGELLYSTCSILPRENDQIVKDLLDSRPDAALLPLPPIPAAEASNNILVTTTGLQLLPTADAHDGFFYAKVGKIR